MIQGLKVRVSAGELRAMLKERAKKAREQADALDVKAKEIAIAQKGLHGLGLGPHTQVQQMAPVNMLVRRVSFLRQGVDYLEWLAEHLLEDAYVLSLTEAGEVFGYPLGMQHLAVAAVDEFDVAVPLPVPVA